MGILPFEFAEGCDADTLNLNGSEKFTIQGLEGGVKVAAKATLKIERENGAVDYADLLLRIDTPVEIDYYNCGGILQCVLKKILK